MSRGFFSKSLLLKEAPASSLPLCGSCGLFKGCKSPKMLYSGRGEKRILIVGEAPGKHEDEKGKQFVGNSGQYLRDVLNDLGVEMRRDCWLTNAIICRPLGNKIPNENVVDYCRPNLARTLRELNPAVIIPLGGTAVSSVIGNIWKDKPGPIKRWTGFTIPSQKPNAWVCPTYHPSYLLREEEELLDREFAAHLREAIRLSEFGQPWTEVPSWDKQVEVELDTFKAAEIIRGFKFRGGMLGFDYENNCLKPETEGAAIICASISDGTKTISYPWHGPAIEATEELLAADNCFFIASNMKHEERWTRKFFNRGVRHWVWDTMLAAHVIDQRTGITGLKFQSYVNLGQPSYDDHIRRLLAPLQGKKLNRAATEIDLFQLCQYCGVDSLLEVKCALKQMEKLETINED